VGGAAAAVVASLPLPRFFAGGSSCGSLVLLLPRFLWGWGSSEGSGAVGPVVSIAFDDGVLARPEVSFLVVVVGGAGASFCWKVFMFSSIPDEEI
jgi:hypothetical protein